MNESNPRQAKDAVAPLVPHSQHRCAECYDDLLAALRVAVRVWREQNPGRIVGWVEQAEQAIARAEGR